MASPTQEPQPVAPRIDPHGETINVDTGQLDGNTVEPRTVGIRTDDVRTIDHRSRLPATGTSTVRRPTVLPPEEPVAAAPFRYEAVRKLGTGGMGEVQLVRDHDIGRTVAVKRPLGRLDEESLQRFAREVRTVGKLEHPSIVPIHDVGADEEGHYFVMKYVEGEPLSEIITKLKARDPAYVDRYRYPQRAHIFMQLLYAVQYAHSRGVLHRDIKPANVMVGPYGEVMLMDWGIARAIGTRDVPSAAARDASSSGGFETTAGALLGSPAYMSPEQARGDLDKLDERSDVYSLCVLFHELLTLRHYLDGAPSTGVMLTTIVSGADPGFMEWITDAERVSVPIELIHYTRLGLRRDPAQRYQRVTEMIEALERVRERRNGVHCHISFVKRVLGGLDHQINRHPRLTSLALIGGTLALAYGLYAGVAAITHALG